MYFVDEETANAEDPVLRMIEPALRRDTRCRRAGKSGIARRSTCSTSTSRARGKQCFSTLEDRRLATKACRRGSRHSGSVPRKKDNPALPIRQTSLRPSHEASPRLIAIRGLTACFSGSYTHLKRR
jgi:hypothetical protein